MNVTRAEVGERLYVRGGWSADQPILLGYGWGNGATGGWRQLRGARRCVRHRSPGGGPLMILLPRVGTVPAGRARRRRGARHLVLLDGNAGAARRAGRRRMHSKMLGCSTDVEALSCTWTTWPLWHGPRQSPCYRFDGAYAEAGGSTPGQLAHGSARYRWKKGTLQPARADEPLASARGDVLVEHQRTPGDVWLVSLEPGRVTATGGAPGRMGCSSPALLVSSSRAAGWLPRSPGRAGGHTWQVEGPTGDWGARRGSGDPSRAPVRLALSAPVRLAPCRWPALHSAGKLQRLGRLCDATSLWFLSWHLSSPNASSRVPGRSTRHGRGVPRARAVGGPGPASRSGAEAAPAAPPTRGSVSRLAYPAPCRCLGLRG